MVFFCLLIKIFTYKFPLYILHFRNNRKAVVIARDIIFQDDLILPLTLRPIEFCIGDVSTFGLSAIY